MKKVSSQHFLLRFVLTIVFITICCATAIAQPTVNSSSTSACGVATSPTTPVCIIDGNLSKACEGKYTSILLDGSASYDPKGRHLCYKWTTTCLDSTLTGRTGSMAILALTSPGKGFNQDCKVTLSLCDASGNLTCCTANIHVDACIPCDGVVDVCGVCNGDGKSCLDCAGIPNGTTTVDLCGVCGGDNSSCADCAGTPNGTSKVDLCGVCNGTNECLESECVLKDFSSNANAVTSSQTALKALVRRLINSLKKSVCRDSAQSKKLIVKAKKLLSSATASSSDISIFSSPTLICSSSVKCSSLDNTNKIKAFTTKANNLTTIAIQLAKARISCSGGSCNGDATKCAARVKARKAEVKADITTGNKLKQVIDINISALPSTTSSCL